ncbi:hypothetical protein L1D14_04155 [Vibrio tubiashii]|uniref:hypothetical protein n=1 Tax=Vibrio tubiashii TaxID=29498 RepID=UPI001EFD2435|nr:hypothetical protein [Vibrio tubiashii]MCG9575424.1 hypothetical protein [Vibrio tubiashii]
MVTGKGKSMFSIVEKTYLFKAGLRHIAERPLVIVGQIGTGTGAVSMAIAGQIRSTVITVNSLSTFVKDGGTDQDITEAYAKNGRVIIQAQSFDELERSGLDYSKFKLLSA